MGSKGEAGRFDWSDAFDLAAKGQALGEASVIAVEQHAGIGVQGVGLNEFRRRRAPANLIPVP
jgi:hypothetical protein